MPTNADLVRRIQTFNRGRDPRLLARKYATMRTSAFAFYRGTCHLFYEDWPQRSNLNRVPLAWVSGDLHPENFGSYRGHDGVVYFDVNDFDEADLGPCVWDVVRCLTGIAIGSAAVGVLDQDADVLARRYIYGYCANLIGTPGVVDADLSRGMVHDLLQAVRRRTNKRLLAERTELAKKGRRIRIDDVHATKLPKAERSYAESVFDAWNAARKRRARYELVDIAERLAGTGSMGVARYVVLAARRRQTSLLDIKLEPPTSSALALRAPQPRWKSEADRVVAVQSQSQAAAPTPLDAVRDGRRSYVVKALQPTADRLRWDLWHGKLDRLEHVAATLGQVTAWSHLRGAGKRGAASAGELAAFASERTWRAEAIEYARAYALRVRADYDHFCRAFDAGSFVVKSSRPKAR